MRNKKMESVNIIIKITILINSNAIKQLIKL